MNPNLIRKLKSELDLDDFVTLCRAFAIADLLDSDFASNFRSASQTLAIAADEFDSWVEGHNNLECCGGCCCCDEGDEGCCGGSCSCKEGSDFCCSNSPICGGCMADFDLDDSNIPSNVTFLFNENGPSSPNNLDADTILNIPDIEVTTHRISSSGLD